jgi:hypothetical protein
LPGSFEAAHGAKAHILPSRRGQSSTANAVKGIFGAGRPVVTTGAEVSQTGIQTVRMGAQQFHAGQASRADAGLGDTAGMFDSSDRVMDMAHQDYRPVYRPRAFDLGEIIGLDGQPTPKAVVIGPDGRTAIAFSTAAL